MEIKFLFFYNNDYVISLKNLFTPTKNDEKKTEKLNCACRLSPIHPTLFNFVYSILCKGLKKKRFFFFHFKREFFEKEKKNHLF